MKLGPVTNTSTSKKFDNDFMLANFDVIVFFLIYGKFTAIREPDSIKIPFSIILTFYLTKPKNRTKKSLIQLLYCCFE